MAVYVCRRCAFSRDSAWEDACPGCGGLYRARKVGVDTVEQKAQRSTFAAAVTSVKVYVPTGVKGVDHVLGGGLVPGSVVLFGGFRGAGKSTLLAMIANELSPRRKTVYASSEERAEGVVQIAHRIGAVNADVVVLGMQSDIDQTLAEVRAERAFLGIYDALQKFTARDSGAAPGSAAQGMAVASKIKRHCQETNTCAIIVNQMTNAGELKGGQDVEHEVDTIVVLAYPKDDDEEAPGTSDEGIRVLSGDKNRNGPENLKSYWRMTKDGLLEPVQPRSKIVDLGAMRRYRRD